MGAMGGMPKNLKTVKFDKLTIFQNWLWAPWALWARYRKVQTRWKLVNLQIFKIGCGHYGCYEHYLIVAYFDWPIGTKDSTCVVKFTVANFAAFLCFDLPNNLLIFASKRFQFMWIRPDFCTKQILVFFACWCHSLELLLFRFQPYILPCLWFTVVDGHHCREEGGLVHWCAD